MNSSSFTVRQGANVVTGTVTYSASTATFTPVQPLLTGSVYTGTISKSVDNHWWCFVDSRLYLVFYN
ncbi:MAG: hypothetical protein IPL20_06655 [Saprospiraceae bacterium]|nr:hypothetical protein [Saprospiraceae bacterium]